jgi:hypothetical protein
MRGEEDRRISGGTFRADPEYLRKSKADSSENPCNRAAALLCLAT